MTRVLLVRHATHDLLGRVLAGWKPGVHLNDEGRAQAERLARRLERAPIAAVYTSPLERARETAEPLAAALGLEASVADALGEVRLGQWTGRAFDELRPDERWRRFNAFRAGTRAPDGEHMLEVQQRVVLWLEQMRERHPGVQVAAVSHGDVIKAALFHYGGISLDHVLRFEIAPASVTTLELGHEHARILGVSDNCASGAA
jgi:probable phosphoglycerate mutase